MATPAEHDCILAFILICINTADPFTESHHAQTRQETTEQKAARLLNAELEKLGWTSADLPKHAKGGARKIRIAARLRAETAVTLKWIAAKLHMGIWTHVANRLQNAKVRKEANTQHELDLV